VGGTLFFAATDGIGVGRELWRSDGTAAGTTLVREVNPGESSSDPDELTNLGGTLLFSAVRNRWGRELWRSDGTADGTKLVKNINRNP
jgi:ELWxxDGT repeat protein